MQATGRRPPARRKQTQISFEELTTALETLGLDTSEKNVHQFLARADDDSFEMADDSHYNVEYDEFLDMMKKMMQDSR